MTFCHLYQAQLDNYLQLLYLGFQLASLIACDRTSNHRSGNTTCSAKSLFGRDKHVGDILKTCKKWKMKEDFKWLSISRHHNELRNPPV
nr:hypothetical protein Iba_chr03aCG5550 [Ipomoea batatas]